MKKRIILPLILILITAIGTFGYVVIEGWSVFDSLYMTIITLTTIGYGEVKPLSPLGKVFNIGLMLLGVGVVTFILTRMVTDIASIDFEKRRRLKMLKSIIEMKGHTIVCGFGRMGEVICRRLQEFGNDFVVIETRPHLIEELKLKGYKYVAGDAANDDHLLQAGIKKASVLVSVIDNDSDGLYIALAGRSMNPELFIIVRANEQKAKKRMLLAGADKIYLPFVMSGEKIADSVINRATEDLFDITENNNDDSKIQLADLFVQDDSLLKGHSLSEMGDKLKDLIIIGIKDQEEKFTFKPGSNYIFKEGDCLIAMGKLKDYQQAKAGLRLG